MNVVRLDQLSQGVVEIRLTIDLRADGVSCSQPIPSPIETATRHSSRSGIETQVRSVQQEITCGRTLVDLHDELLSAQDREQCVSEKTIKNNRSMLRRFEQWLDLRS